MKLPFERLVEFTVWYIAPDLPLVVLNSDLLKIINAAPFDDPRQSAGLKMAVFHGIGNSKQVFSSAAMITKEIKLRIDSNGWPYSYRFHNREAIAAFEAYTSAFCFCNKNILAEEHRTSIDGHVSYVFRHQKLFSKIDLVSFSKNVVISIIGPSIEYFVGLSNGDYMYFGQGSIKRLYSDDLGHISKEPDYHELMAASYDQRHK